MRGLFAGIVWGGVVAGIGLGTLSVLTPLPPTAPEGGQAANASEDGQGATGPAADQAVEVPEVIEPAPGTSADPGSDAPDAEAAAPANASADLDDQTAEAEPVSEDSASGASEPGAGMAARPDAEEAGSDPSAATEETIAQPADDAAPGLALTDPELPAAPAPDGTVSAPALPESDPAPATASQPAPVAAPVADETMPDLPESSAPGRVELTEEAAALPAPATPAISPVAPETSPSAPAPDGSAPARPIASAADQQPVSPAAPVPPASADSASRTAEPEDLPQTSGNDIRPPADAPAAEEGQGGNAAAIPPVRSGPVRDLPGISASAPRFAGTVPGVTTGRLPSITAPGSAEPSGAEDENAATVPEGSGADAVAESDAPPVLRYARAFDNPEGKPVFAIVLRDTGGPDIDREALAALTVPVSFAIDPTLPDAETAAAIYRAAGQEVLMLATGIPEGATASDVEVTFESHSRMLDESVAVLEPETGGVQGNRVLAQQVLTAVKAQGRGVLSWERGLNALSQIARRDGLENAVVFRSLDSAGEAAPVIRRYLDRAAFKAAQDGRVVVAGTTRPETVAAILEWLVEGRADTVALAPVTAAMTAQ